MKCRRCGADLLDTDTFCVKCGQKVDQPMFCSKCGERLRDGERFCHKCGSPVEPVEEEEIPLSEQRTVDIPFDQIEQGILLEAEQAIVKRPGAEKTERRNPDSYRRPGTEMSGGYMQHSEERLDGRNAPPSSRAENYVEIQDDMPESVRDTGYHKDFEEERYESSARPKRRTPPPRRYEEDYEEYDDDGDDEDSGDSRMKIITAILGIVVVAIALAIGFILWQRNNPNRYERNDAETEQGEEGEDVDAEEGDADDTQGRIQILSNVNVRTAPTTEGSEVLMVAKQGETYEYYELVDDAWYHIKLEDGGDGYVSKKYVEDLE